MYFSTSNKDHTNICFYLTVFLIVVKSKGWNKGRNYRRAAVQLKKSIFKIQKEKGRIWAAFFSYYLDIKLSTSSTLVTKLISYFCNNP